MKPTITLSKTEEVDWNKARQFRSESEQVTSTISFGNLVALMPSLGGGLVGSTMKSVY